MPTPELQTVSNEALVVLSMKLMNEIIDILNRPFDPEMEDIVETKLSVLDRVSNETGRRADAHICINPPPNALQLLQFMQVLARLEELKRSYLHEFSTQMKHNANNPSPHQNN